MIKGELPETFDEVCYFERCQNGALHQRLADLKKLDDKTGKAELVVHLPTKRVRLTGVPHTPGVANGWGYPGEQPAKPGPDEANDESEANP